MYRGQGGLSEKKKSQHTVINPKVTEPGKGGLLRTKSVALTLNNKGKIKEVRVTRQHTSIL
jgi:hypothetical protein